MAAWRDGSDLRRGSECEKKYKYAEFEERASSIVEEISLYAGCWVVHE
jgi:hypothetical protein